MNDIKCSMCGKKLKTWKSIQKGIGSKCEKKLLEKLNKNQMKMEDLECTNLKYQEK